MMVEFATPVMWAQFLPAIIAIATIASTTTSIVQATREPPKPTNQLPPNLNDPTQVQADLRREALRRGRASTINPVISGASELLAETDTTNSGSALTLGG